MNKKGYLAIGIIVLAIIIDQASKIWIKTNLMIGEEIFIFDQFRLHFVENKGMAFGLELGGSYGKLVLSLFRIVAVVFIGYFLTQMVKAKEVGLGLVASMALIFSGAVGNIIDSTIYGIIFNDSFGQIATFLPKEGGYSSLFHGRVVDMLYFPLFEGFLPQWLPFFGGKYVLFFRPVFNIADSCITIGVITVLLFQRNFFLENNLEDVTNPKNDADLIPPVETNIDIPELNEG